jgi:hypothetical protein
MRLLVSLQVAHPAVRLSRTRGLVPRNHQEAHPRAIRAMIPRAGPVTARRVDRAPQGRAATPTGAQGVVVVVVAAVAAAASRCRSSKGKVWTRTPARRCRSRRVHPDRPDGRSCGTALTPARRSRSSPCRSCGELRRGLPTVRGPSASLPPRRSCTRSRISSQGQRRRDLRQGVLVHSSARQRRTGLPMGRTALASTRC